MQLLGLAPLYRSMREQGLNRQKFLYKHGRATFDVFFCIDVKPFELLFGCLGANFALTVEVNPGFVINPYLGAKYGELCELLGLSPDPNNRFSPVAFFMEFNKRIPRVARSATVPRPNEIAVYRRDVEDSEKIYFCGWRNNNARGEHVTERNLDKTLKLLGQNAHDFCKRHNISSCWTDDKEMVIEVTIP